MKWMSLLWTITCTSVILMAGLPSSTNYTLQSYGIGGGSTAGSSSANYSVNGIAGEQSGGQSSSANYNAGAGYNYTLQANEPLVTLSNPTSSYNTLVVQISDTQNNASDAKYAVEISPDNFTTVYYVQSDYSIGPSLSAADFMSYASWGSSGGVTISGLGFNTVYKARAAASHGNYTQSGWGPASTAATTNTPSITFSIAVNPTYVASTTPPFIINFGNLLPGVTTAADKIWLTVSTNGSFGMSLYGGGQNGGLVSGSTGHTIASSSANLATQTEGFGEQDSSATQSSGAALTEMSPYNVSGTNVGEDYTDLDEMFYTNGPVSGAEGGVSLLAKTNLLTPVANDYTETMTVVAAGAF